MENKIIKNSLISNELDEINVIQNYFLNNYQTIKKEKSTLYHYKKTYKQTNDILIWYKQFIKDNEKSIPVLIFDELINRIDLAFDSVNHIINELDNLDNMISNNQEINFNNLLNLISKHMECMYSVELKTEEMVNSDLNKEQLSLQEIDQNDDEIETIVDNTDNNINEEKETDDISKKSNTIDIGNISVGENKNLESNNLNFNHESDKIITPEKELEFKNEQINKIDYNKIEYDREVNYSIEVFTARTLNELELLSARRKVLENKSKITIKDKMEIAMIIDRIQLLQSSLAKVQEKNVTTFKDKKMDKLYDQEKELQQKLDSVKQEEYDSNLFEIIKNIRIKYLNSKINKKADKFQMVKQNQTERSLLQFESKEAIARFKSFFTGNIKATKQIYQETTTDLKRFISKLKNKELQEEINLMNSMGVIIEGEKNINTDENIELQEENIKLVA